MYEQHQIAAGILLQHAAVVAGGGSGVTPCQGDLRECASGLHPRAVERCRIGGRAACQQITPPAESGRVLYLRQPVGEQVDPVDHYAVGAPAAGHVERDVSCGAVRAGLQLEIAREPDGARPELLPQ